MKRLCKILCLILVIISVFSFASCNDENGPKIENIGVPSAERFKWPDAARCVWDMKVWNGILYVGSGDYSANTGPTDVWAYDISKGTWSSSGKVNEEAVLRFNVIGNHLMIPGADPKDGWGMGNYYKLEQGTWTKYNVLPKAVHAFDMIEYNGEIIVGIGSAKEGYLALSSKDGGQTFEYIEFMYNNKPRDFSKFDVCRMYELFTLNGTLYGFAYNSGNNPSAEINVYKNGKFHYYKSGVDFWQTTRITSNVLGSKEEFNGKLFFCHNYLYSTSNLKDVQKVKLPLDENTSQFRIYDGKMYVLCYEKKGDRPNVSYTVRIYESQTGLDGFNEICEFEFDVPPLSFDKDGNTFYVGMGEKKEGLLSNGTVFKITI